MVPPLANTPIPSPTFTPTWDPNELTGSARFYYNKRVGRYNAEEYELAVIEFEKPIYLHASGYGDAYLYRGHIDDELGQFRRAIQDFDQAIKFDAYFTGAYHSRGIVYHEIGEHRRAIEGYVLAIELDPAHAYAFDNRNLALNELGQYTLAEQDAKIACKLNTEFC